MNHVRLANHAVFVLLKEVVQMGLRFNVSSVEGKMTSLNPAKKKVVVSGKRTVITH